MERLLLGAQAVVNHGALALDGGCGDGNLSRRLAQLGYQVNAFDRYEHDGWRDCDGVNFKKGDIREVPPSARAQLVCLSGLLHYFSDADEVDRVLKRWCNFILPGGRLIANWIDDSLPYPGNAFLPSTRAVSQALHSSGLSKVEQWGAHIHHIHAPHGNHHHAITYAIWQRD